MFQKIKKYIKSRARSMLGFNEVIDTIRSSNNEVINTIRSSDNEVINTIRASTPSLYEILPGSEYAKFALPIDYLPSREFKPRWGYSHPPIEALTAFFTRYQKDYKELLSYLRSLNPNHIAPVLTPAIMQARQPAWLGGAMSPFDELALYGLVGKYKPARFFEVGSGISTCFARQAITDFKLPTRVVSIDPEPRSGSAIDAFCDEIYRKSLETMDVSYFDQLEAGDICYIDGSHRSFTNSDVTVFFIDILPRIKPGVIIHIHDISLPWDYHDMFLNWYWNEQYLLAVYLLAAQEVVVPLFPTAFVCRSPLFEEHFQTPFIDCNELKELSLWRGGGSFWFTKKERPK